MTPVYSLQKQLPLYFESVWFSSVGIGKGEDGMFEAPDTIGQRGALLPAGSLGQEGLRLGR